MVLDLSGLAAWVLLALPVGLFAARVMAGPGRDLGLVGETALGLVGALGGGLAAAVLGVQGQVGWLVGLAATTVGAVALTRLARAWAGRAGPTRSPARGV